MLKEKSEFKNCVILNCPTCHSSWNSFFKLLLIFVLLKISGFLGGDMEKVEWKIGMWHLLQQFEQNRRNFDNTVD